MYLTLFNIYIYLTGKIYIDRLDIPVTEIILSLICEFTKSNIFYYFKEALFLWKELVVEAFL